MKNTRPILVLLSLSLGLRLLTATALGWADDHYYDGDSLRDLAPSSQKIAVQFYSTSPPQQGFLARHSCLDSVIQPQYLARGFWVYEIAPGCGFSSIASDLLLDSLVHRAVPVYLTVPDSAEVKVTDLVSVQFVPGLTLDSMTVLLNANGLAFVDSSRYSHGLWLGALQDSIRTSPVPIGTHLHELPQTYWACAEFYGEGGLLAIPDDKYLPKQYYLLDTSVARINSNARVDIDIEGAWQFALVDSFIIVAVIDAGIDWGGPPTLWHDEVHFSRFINGTDVAGNTFAPFQNEGTRDDDPTPGYDENHGNACCGIIAAAHGSGRGVAGIIGSCRIVPIKITSDGGVVTSDNRIAEGIRFANSSGARIVSNSWFVDKPGVINESIANAIRDAVCPDRSMGNAAHCKGGIVFVFAAGNGADLGDPLVQSPANLPYVIGVGAVKRSGEKWEYSAIGSALDVVAPSGYKKVRCLQSVA